MGMVAGVSAAVFYGVLRHEWPVNLLSKFFNDHEGKAWTKPMWFCIYCISGQWGLWSYVFIKLLQHDQNPVSSILGTIFTICISIFIAMLSTRAITILKQ